jgi:tetratricopeptide (TPR) repeat protein
MNNKAYLLISSGSYDEALEMLNQAYDIAAKENYNMEFMYIQRNLGEVYLKKGMYEKSLYYLKQSAFMANDAGIIDLYISLLELIAEAYEQTGDFKKAYEHFKKAKLFNDSIFNAEMRQNIYNYQNRYEVQMEESQLLMKDLQILRHKSAVRNQFYLFVVILLVLIGAGVMLLISRKNKERMKEKSFMQEIVKFQQKALSAQMNPHFVSNSLNSIQRFYLQNDYETATDYLSEFGALIRIILENSSKELISVDEEVKFIRAYLKLEHLRLERKFNYHIHVQSDLNAMQVNIPPLILQPFVENAVWHGIAPLKSDVKPQLFINFRKEGDFLVIEVDDEGIGIEASEKIKQRFSSGRKSYAMEINSKRLQLFETLINEKIVLTVFDKKQQNQQGTKVIIRIPLKFTIFTT